MTLTEKAYAKINLYLDVTGRREDGFHNIVSVMHSVSLSDLLTVTAEPSDNTQITIHTNVVDLPTDGGNLVYRAAALYLSTFNLNATVHIDLDKSIPIGAGLGGGSSDAAAILRVLNKIFNLATYNDLLALAAELGSDVPFCLVGGLAVCTGRGDQVSPLSPYVRKTFVLAIGESRISTPKAYAELDRLYGDFSDGERRKDSADHNDRIIDLLLGVDVPVPIYNIFEQAADIEEINKIKEIMIKNGAEYALMSGSGPSVFGAFSDLETAELICKKLCDEGYTATVATSVYFED